MLLSVRMFLLLAIWVMPCQFFKLLDLLLICCVLCVLRLSFLLFSRPFLMVFVSLFFVLLLGFILLIMKIFRLLLRLNLSKMCEFLLPSIRCAVTGDCCHQSAQMDYLDCASRNLGLTTLYDYSAFWCYAQNCSYPRHAPPEFDFERDIFQPCPF